MEIDKNRLSRIIAERRLSSDKLKDLMLKRIEETLKEPISDETFLLIGQYAWLRSDLSPVYELVRKYKHSEQAVRRYLSECNISHPKP